ncbi:hypothetical protein NDI76_19550 [Halogeometricum sp. S1BR25-6]|uniref:DUF4143 domain-containing protein n=1 Tax=Halogeometricum salsisoli TaxID=2950536 RepID=A0ABU2GJG7_9EURY|nr:hypothetical protein [Halogeometricum sp. S1BR25-6]MDS0300946.1 hypothetical protein [Halogeometricum sp. S1BR25-6]
MSLDPTNAEEGHYLIQRLSDYNPWWEQGAGAAATDEFVSLRSDFYGLHKSIITDENHVFGIAGPDGIGKTDLLRQLISALIDPDFVEKFYRHPGFRDKAHEAVVPPEHILYIPLSATPLIQIQAPAQLRAAIDHFETHYCHSGSETTPSYIILDDLGAITPGNGRGQRVDWATTLADLVTDNSTRRFVLTAVSDSQLKPPLATADLTSTDADELATVSSMLPMKFTDFARFRFRELETTASDNRFSASKARAAFAEAVSTGNATQLANRLNTEVENAVVSGTDLRRELSNYLTIGGFVGLRLAAAGVLTGDQLAPVLRGRGELDINAVQQRALTAFRHMLRERGPELGAVEEPAGLERLCALVAAEHPSTSVQFTTLTDLFDIDRRTLRRKYFGVLSKLYALAPSPEYDNLRPRSVRVYLRDPGIANAFMNRDLNGVLGADADVEAALSKSVLFDHTVRLSYLLNDAHDPKRGVVKFWNGSVGEIDFIPKFNGRPVPMYWARQRNVSNLIDQRNQPGGFAALLEFLNSDASASERDSLDTARYETMTETDIRKRRDYVTNDYHGTLDGDEVYDGEPPFGVMLTTDHGDSTAPVTVHESDGAARPIVRIPQWVYLRLV